ncbi:MAG TPA: ABC transporter permease [Acidimicrobiales bacterium]|nr:ABC transporter permease [Acidimicrobiales bacterium]
MLRSFAGKVLYLIPVLIAVTALSYLLLKLLPGDPAVNILGPSATPAAVRALHKSLGLDKPVLSQYWHFVWNALHGDFGRSYQNNQPTLEALRQRLPVTLELLVLSQFLALVVSIPLAIRAATRPDGLLDRISTGVSFGFLALPSYVVGVVLVLVFAVQFHLFPATGYVPLTQNPVENLRSLTLPSITLAVAELATYMRLLRADMIMTLQEDFITMARAKGMPPRRILWLHAFRPSSFSLVTVAGLNFGRLIGGTFIVEILFALPGIGELTVQSIFSADYLVVQGTVLLVAVGYVMVNFLVDLLYVVIDPRVRHAASAS